MADDSAQEDSDGQGHNPLMVRHAQGGLEPLRFNWFAAVRLYNALTIAPLQERSYKLTCI